MAKTVTANQIFIGCPWKTIKSKYEGMLSYLHNSQPLSFILIGREDDQSAEDLFNVIKSKLTSSSYAIFDVTYGNANVSLEFGIADALEIPSALYLNTFKSPSKSQHDRAIISDLSGRRRKEYKNETQLWKLLEQFCKSHEFTKKFSKCMEKQLKRYSRGKKRRYKLLALRCIHSLDSKEKIRREDLFHSLSQTYTTVEIETVLKILKSGNLLSVSQGRYSFVELA